jgi:hypothetical protein
MRLGCGATGVRRAPYTIFGVDDTITISVAQRGSEGLGDMDILLLFETERT